VNIGFAQCNMKLLQNVLTRFWNDAGKLTFVNGDFVEGQWCEVCFSELLCVAVV